LPVSHKYMYVKFYIFLKYAPVLNLFQISDLNIQKYAVDIWRQIPFRNISEDFHVWHWTENEQSHIVLHIKTVGTKKLK